MDVAQLLFVIGFEGALVVVAVLLVATFAAFRRMNNDVRRARMFIMADRVVQFLGAFTVGFVVITADFAMSLLSIPGAVFVNLAAILIFVGAILYGSFQLFLVVRPRQAAHGLRGARSRRAVVPAEPVARHDDPPEGETDASR